MRPRGWFITFEGIEGSGKSTQIRALARALGRRGHRVLVTREPGGTPAGEAIRGIFLGAAAAGIDPWTEVFLVEAARAEHLARVVRPALASGRIVLCDRFTDSTLAYQGAGRGLPLGPLRRLHAMAALGPPPDLTIVLDVPLRTGLARAADRNRSRRRASAHSRLDEESRAFHARVRRAFLALARAEPQRILRLPADGAPREVRARVIAAVLESLGGRTRPSKLHARPRGRTGRARRRTG